MAGSLTPWITQLPGVEQMRVEDPSGWLQPEGDHAMVLGSDEAGREGRFGFGDWEYFTQTVTYAPAKIARFSGKIRGPSRMPAVSIDEPGAGYYVLADGQTLILNIGGSDVTITFTTAQFADITKARAWEVRAAIQTALDAASAPAVAYLTGMGVGVMPTTTGRGSRIKVEGGTAVNLGFLETAWRFVVAVNGTEIAELYIFAGEEKELKDWGVNLESFPDPATLRFSVELAGV